MAAKRHVVKPVLVHWLDSMAQPGWGDYVRDPDLVCTTVGYFVERTASCIVVALSKSERHYADYLTIPRCAIQSITPLVPAPAKPPSRRIVTHG